MKKLKYLVSGLLLAAIIFAVPFAVTGCAGSTVKCTLGQTSKEVKVTSKGVNFKIVLEDDNVDLAWSVTYMGDGGYASSGYFEVEFRSSKKEVLWTGHSSRNSDILEAGTYYLNVKIKDEYYNRYGLVSVKFYDRNA